jgi:putative transposase
MDAKYDTVWLKLAPNASVHYGGRACRVKTAITLDTVLLEDPQTHESFSAKISDLLPEFVSEDCKRKPALNLLAIAEEDWNRAKHRQSVLDLLLQKIPCTTDAVVDAAQQLGLSERQIYNLIKHYQRSNFQLAALLPIKPSGGKGKLRIPANIEAIIAAAIQEVYLDQQRFPVSWVVLEVKKRCREGKLEPPSDYAIRARIKQLPLKTVLTQRYGDKIAREQTSPIIGEFPEPPYPLAILQIDHTLVDVIIVDEYQRKPIGRPYITVAIDVFSRCITGFCLTLEAPSALSVGLCLTHSVFDKEEWLSLRKIEALWPIWGKPEGIYVDNAAEFHSEALARGCDFHGIKLQYRPPGLPHYGGIVERVIGTLMGLIHQVPGTTFSNVEERGDYNSEKKAVLTLAELEKWLTIAITNYYHQKVHQGIQVAPLEKYKTGILGDQNTQGRGYPPRIYNKKAFLIDFLPIERRSLQRAGFVLEHITYYSNALAPWIAKRKMLGKFVIRRDPRDLSRVFVLDPELNQYLEIPYRALARPTITLWEQREAIKTLRMQSAEINETLIFRAIDEMRTITKEAVAKSRLARRKQERLKGIEEKVAQVYGETIQKLVEETPPAKPFADIEIWEIKK